MAVLPKGFAAAAIFIAKNNISEDVTTVLMRLDEAAGHLDLLYLVRGEVSYEELTHCNLCCAEMASEFPMIRTADQRCEPYFDYRHLFDEKWFVAYTAPQRR